MTKKAVESNMLESLMGEGAAGKVSMERKPQFFFLLRLHQV